jgi:hypothetical protein
MLIEGVIRMTLLKAYVHTKRRTASPIPNEFDSYCTQSVPVRETTAPQKGQTRTGYGKHIPTPYEIKWLGRWRRVKVAVFSNAGTAFIGDTLDVCLTVDVHAMTDIEQIEYGMARAFFCSAYADMAEEADTRKSRRLVSSMSGRDWMDVLPDEIDTAAEHAARTLMIGMAIANKASAQATWHIAQLKCVPTSGDRECTPELFGHYCAMQAMGHGVGLRDAFGSAVADVVKVPYVEFGSHSLQKDYF